MIKKTLMSVGIICALLTVSLAWAGVVTVTVGSGSGSPGDANKEIPISVNNVSGEGVISVDLQLNYDATRLSFASLTSSGTITQAWGNPIYNANTPGQLKIALYGTTPLSGQGQLVKIYFNVNAAAPSGASALTLTKAKFNNGVTTTSTIQNGTFAVTSQNHPPVLDPIGNKEVNEGSTLVFNLLATDEDGDPLTYSATGLPQGATLNLANNTFTWQPNYNQAGSYNISFSVSDGRGGTDSETITITVNNVLQTFSLTINAVNGSVTKNPNQSSYTEGTVVTLTVTANTGYTFTGWSGDLTGSANPATITMSSNKTVTANFTANAYTLSINASNGSVTKSPNQASYAYGTVVTLTATPNTGYSFTGWSGDLSGSTNPATITMDANKTVTANFAINNYTLTINATNGSVVKSPNQASYAYGTVVTLTATPNTGYSFTGWSGDLTGSANPTTITMNSNKTVTANFTANAYTLTINAQNGSVTKNPNQASYDYGTVVTLTAVPNTGYNFTGWSGDLSGSTNPATITMDANKTVTANFTINSYTLTINAANGSVTKAPNQAIYAYGTVVTLTATANTGYSFTGWSGDLTGSANPTTITMNSNKTVTANFTANAYTLTINAQNGSVTKNPNQASYDYGTVVTLTAVPNTGYSFSGWSGDLSGSTNPATITMNANKTVTANFAINNYTLTINAQNGSVTKNPNQASYDYGTVVTLTASPNTGYSFTGWSGDLTGSANPATITMSSNKTVTANFTANAYTLTVNATNGSVAKSPNQASYAYGTVVTLTATPNTGYSFTGWSGDLSGSTNPATITMDANKTVTANFTINNYTLTINAANGSVTKTPNQTSYDYGTVVTLTASPNTGYNFTGWSGDLSGSTNPATITMDGNKTVTANFTAISGVTVTVSNGSGNVGQTGISIPILVGDVTGLGFISCDIRLSYDISKLTLSGVNSTGTISQSWGAPTYNLVGDELRISLYGTSALTGSGSLVNIVFDIQGTASAGEVNLDLTRAKFNNGSIPSTLVDGIFTINPLPNRAPVLAAIGNKTVNEGQLLEFTLSATDPDNDPLTYLATGLPTGATLNATSGAFSWTPNYTQAGSYPITFSVSDGRGGTDSETITITVNNVLQTFSLTINAVNGSVTKNPNQSSYTEGTVVTLTVTANTGYTFTGWSGDLTGSANPATITMSSNKTVTANFTANAYTLSINASNGSVTKSPNQASYAYGTVVTLTATPNTGYSFTGWSGDLSGSANPATITMNSNKTVTANFTANAYTLSINASNGSVTKNPDQPSYASGTVVTLTASPNTGYNFTGWSGDLSGSTNPATITMSSNKTVTANFTAISGVTVTVSNGSGNVGQTGISIPILVGDVTGLGFISCDIRLRYDISKLTLDGVNSTGSISQSWGAPTYNLVGDELRISLYGTSALDGSGKLVNVVFNIKGTASAGEVNLDLTRAKFNNGSIPSTLVDGILTILPNPNHPPVLASIGNKTTNEGQALNIQLQATDPDNDPLTYSTTGLPTGATLNSTTGAFSWTPTYTHAGSYPITFSVSDGKGGSDSEEITITINNVNQAPVLAAIGNKSIDEGETLEFTVSAEDIDKDKLTYSAAGLPEGASLDSKKGIFKFTPNYDQAANYKVTFMVSDGQLSDSEEIVITVNNLTRKYQLKIQTDHGSVIKKPEQETYDEESSVILSAAPSEGYTFSQWSGDLSGISNPATIVMDKDKSITAVFADSRPPDNCSLVINQGAEYTNKLKVNLSLSARDLGSGLSKMQFSDDGTKWSPPKDYAPSTDWTLPPHDGTKTVYAKVIDAAGNESAVFSDSIILDTQAPDKPILNPTLHKTKDTDFRLSGTKEANSNILVNGEEKVAIDNKTDWSCVIKLEEGNNVLKITSQDAAGNESPPVVEQVFLKTKVKIRIIWPLKRFLRLKDLVGDSKEIAILYIVDEETSPKSKMVTLEAGKQTEFMVEAKDDLGNKAEEKISLGLYTVAPQINITNYEDGQSVSSRDITLKGETIDAGCGVQYVKVNGKSVALSGNNFSANLALSEGTNDIAIEAADNAENTSTAFLVLRYVAAVMPTPTPSPAPTSAPAPESSVTPSPSAETTEETAAEPNLESEEPKTETITPSRIYIISSVGSTIKPAKAKEKEAPETKSKPIIRHENIIQPQESYIELMPQSQEPQAYNPPSYYEETVPKFVVKKIKQKPEEPIKKESLIPQKQFTAELSKELIETSVVTVKKLWGFWILKSYRLQISGIDEAPVSWELGKNQQLPFWLILNKKKGDIFGLVWGKKEVELKLYIITSDGEKKEVTCKLKN